VLDVQQRCFYSFDSMSSSSSSGRPPAEASKLAWKLAPLLPKDSSDGGANAGKNVRLVSPPTPQQSNSSDCGLFALVVTEELARLRADHPDADGEGDSEGNNIRLDSPATLEHLAHAVPKSVSRKRKEILEVIEKHKS
jgi:Ulp1 family protease